MIRKKTERAEQFLVKLSDIKFHDDPFSCSRVQASRSSAMRLCVIQLWGPLTLEDEGNAEFHKY